jgi:hypothetical protein
METLIELDRFGPLFLTDKEYAHGYLNAYDALFSPFRNKALNIFEVGYWFGGSCELWKRYFPKAYIYAIDIALPRSTARRCKAKCITTFIPATERVFLSMINIWDLTASYFEDHHPHIAIDDGSHMIQDQVRFIQVTYPMLHKGGLLIVEDIQDIKNQKVVFDALGIPYEVFDCRNGGKEPDSIFLLFRK